MGGLACDFDSYLSDALDICFGRSKLLDLEVDQSCIDLVRQLSGKAINQHNRLRKGGGANRYYCIHSFFSIVDFQFPHSYLF